MGSHGAKALKLLSIVQSLLILFIVGYFIIDLLSDLELVHSRQRRYSSVETAIVAHALLDVSLLLLSDRDERRTRLTVCNFFLHQSLDSNQL